MSSGFSSQVIKKSLHNDARITEITTPHGTFLTPAFMPVGTRAFVNHLTPDDLHATKTQIILGGNTYHMLVNPGLEVIQALSGMHSMMHWNGPMLTDSGGFQVFSLSKNEKICKIDEKGAHFKHPVNGKLIHLTPASSIHAQKIIGADIIMAFDQCTPESEDKNIAIAAMERTHRWLLESIEAHQHSPCSAYGYQQALFGIIQGGSFYDLRQQSAEFVLKQPLDGIAIGGEVIGFDMKKTVEVIDWLKPLLPENKPRYTMGVGSNPQDLIDVVAQGIDMFDCVAPTRNARHGYLFHGNFIIENHWVKFEPTEEKGRILIKKSKYAKDDSPLLEGCDCYTCAHFSRGYLHFLMKQQSSLYFQLACVHNIRLMQKACEIMRLCIKT